MNTTTQTPQTTEVTRLQAKGRPVNPDKWISGPDPTAHRYYGAFTQQRNQAKFRKEGWNMTFAEWYAIWGHNIINRGRKKSQLTMTRPNINKPWSVDNVLIITRSNNVTLKEII